MTVAADPVCSITTDTDGGPWDGYVSAHPDASGYHRWAWRQVFRTGLGHRCHYLLARRGADVCGVLPLVAVRSRVFGRALSSLPYVNYGGVLADDDLTASRLVERAGALAVEQGLSFVLLRHRRRLLPSLPVREHKVTMLLPLKETRDAMWNGLDRKVRNQVRKAEKSALTVVSGGVELLSDFYRVFARNMRDLGTPVYGASLFRAILENLPDSARLHLVRLGGETIAGALSYADREWIEVPSASSLREHRALCPNHLLYWTMIGQAIDDGRRVFDFGRSTPNDGTFQFKEQWGATPEPLFWEYWLGPGVELPVDDRHSSKFKATIAVWKRLPLGLANWVGPAISRAVP